MSRFTPIVLGLALPISLASQAAWADLSPSEVWGDWRSYLEGMGYEVMATESRNGDDLSVNDFSVRFALPEQEGDVTMALGTISFNQNRDGTVAIVMPDTMPISMKGKNSALPESDFTMEMTFAQKGQAITASGDSDAITYLYTAQSFALNLLQMMANGQNLGEQNIRMTVNGSDINSSVTMKIGDLRTYDQSANIANLDYDIFVKSIEGDEGEGVIKGKVNGISMTGQGAVPLAIAPGTDVATMLAAGFDMAGAISYAAGSAAFDIKDPQNGNYVMNSTSQGGEIKVKMGAAGLAYDVAQRDLNLSVAAEAMPLPFEIQMAQSGFNLAMPVSKSDEVQDFALGIKMTDFTMSDFIWGMFDPSGQLPRDPATIMLDLTGKAKLLIDWMNPKAVEEMTGSPGELKAVNLENLVVDAAGAKLEGNGGITFDGKGASVIPGMGGLGSPVGDINLALAGGNGLLDKLVAMGLLPADQAMGARMMMGLFAVPGSAPDTLKSKIEFTSDGQILANGQRLR
ncbi:hypothetical protein OS190_00500 [Sulfitobacter sp. F26204]|uniref:hypothetical protein n=1 Tax=Sulfitobacter sp. F26204 TaxID=2996014 RepID=UPI00225E104B|nr:hypothetical protein [Sulfitobacter sp. F26204]MCX7558026.1 hypothetical protein [Sulfitobacter sp. F26204]